MLHWSNAESIALLWVVAWIKCSQKLRPPIRSVELHSAVPQIWNLPAPPGTSNLNVSADARRRASNHRPRGHRADDELLDPVWHTTKRRACRYRPVQT